MYLVCMQLCTSVGWKKACIRSSMFQDLAYALRTLKKTPGFTAVAVVSMALGIGANSAIFSFANGILLRPLPVPNPSQVIVVQSHLRGESLGGVFQYSEVSYPDFVDLRNRSRSFAGLAASEYTPFGFTVEKDALPQMKFGVMVSGDFFRVLHVRPVLGRGFRADEDRVAGRDAVAVLGYDLWKTEFAANPDVIGRTIYLNGIAFTVVGVAPESFTGPHPMIRGSMYVPLAMAPRLAGESRPNPLERRGDRVMFVHGRLNPGVTTAQAAAEASVISQQLAQAYPETNRTCSLVTGTDLQSRFRQNPADTMLLLVLLGMAGVVLLIACANVMNLMLSRGRARSREIAVRLAIGAGRGRLIRQFLTESLVIALLGGVFGLVVAEAGADVFSQFRIPGDIPIVVDFRLDPLVLLLTVLASMASAFLFGLVPALQSTRPDLVPALKSGTMGGGRRRQFLGRNVLVIAQVAGSLLLLILATQAYRGASIVLSSPAGFRTDHLLTASFDPSLARYTPAQTQDFYERLLERARALTGVKAAALMEAVPLLPFGSQNRILPEGVQLPPGTEAVKVMSNTVSVDYFDVVDIPVVAGRGFAVTDRAGSPRVAIVNELFARKYYPNQGAVGKRFRLDSAGAPAIEIVGVARQSKYMFPVEPPLDYIYLPLAQRPQTAMTLMLYTAVPPADLAGPLRALVRSLDAGQPVIGIRTMDEIFTQRARTTIDILIETIAGMGVLGLILALVGLYGLMAYSVGLRQREIGIRMAIGADQLGVVKMVLKQGMTLAGMGVGIGLLLWLLASRPVMAIVEARSFSWSLLALVAAGLLVVAAVGAYIPARRASLVDPNTVLRQE
jgi:predicted permease